MGLGSVAFGQGTVPEPGLPPALIRSPRVPAPAPRAVPRPPVPPPVTKVPPALARYSGFYYVIPERSDSTILAIDPAVKRLNWFSRGVARNHLDLVNPPCGSVTIQVINARTVSVGTDQWPTWQHTLDGPPIHWRRNAAEQYDVSLRFSHGGLEQRFVGTEGERINRYFLSDHDTVLQMEVLVISPKLQQAVHYTLAFSRI